MTKNKLQRGSGSVPAAKVQIEIETTPKIKVEEDILPSGGLAIPQQVAHDSIPANSTPAHHAAGAATPASGASGTGGYFAQFKDFTPQVDAGFLSNFNKLSLEEKWSKGEKARRRNEAVEMEFAHYFGTDYHDVARWQELCRLVGLETAGLTSITQCKKALKSRKVMVNLVNLVDHLKNGTPLKKFKNFWEFQRYTLKPGRCMNLKLAKQNHFVAAFMRHVA
ncbi:hypothetical protein BU23DRAFT_562538 [Bimuria novae-zelandiae CBS 107.79]|uniref:Uncharacterized protein n=1 Tax=Bimuria novae-zelandiae CBS 107.79 TaxID=1447943 RepID=A0A6A5W3S6_9PLEO|nr:hypothetical protein BU23DRAFT_562538 [Bimuria novae-zelandiae CBS 107.79]